MFDRRQQWLKKLLATEIRLELGESRNHFVGDITAISRGQALAVTPSLLPDAQRLGEMSGFPVDDSEIELQSGLPGRLGVSSEKRKEWCDCIRSAGFPRGRLVS